MAHDYEFEHGMGLSAEALESSDFLDLAAKFGRMARMNEELLRRLGVQPWERYIGANALKKHLSEWARERYKPHSLGLDVFDDVITAIDEHPTAVYVKKGNWKKTNAGKEYCGVCGHFIHPEETARDYCPHCGASMGEDISPVGREWRK